MKRSITILLFLLIYFSSKGQTPKLELKIDGERNTRLDSINVFFKTNNSLIDILNNSTGTIVKPIELKVDSIQSILLVIQNDTLEFFDTKSVLNSNFPPTVKEALMPQYRRMLDSDINWSIYLDNYPFENEDVTMDLKKMLEGIHENKRKIQFVVIHIINTQVGHRIMEN